MGGRVPFAKRPSEEKNIMIRTKFAESSKSLIGTHFSKIGCSVFFCCSSKYAKTRLFLVLQSPKIHFSAFQFLKKEKGRQISTPSGLPTGKIPKYDYNPYDVVLFDEINVKPLYLE